MAELTPNANGLNGRRELIEWRLNNLDERLAKQETAMDQFHDTIKSLEQNIIRFEQTQMKREAIDEALRDAAAKLVKKQLTTRQFLYGMVTLLLTIGLFFLTLISTIGIH